MKTMVSLSLLQIGGEYSSNCEWYVWIHSKKLCMIYKEVLISVAKMPYVQIGLISGV